ncbi:MAG: AarF/ABC1/UbiB kinase family protein [Deltaproteobacteria bacterium]|nr:AarF/ABC1/UbiB kinase family protein [Deltaproteobacteria bacterium]
MTAFFLCSAALLVGFLAWRLLRPSGARRIATGRMSRMLGLGRLLARVSTSWLGARVRRLLSGKEGRRRIDEAQRKASAEAVARTMGQMKGVLMKLGQMASFVSDGVPEEYRSALASLQAQAPPMDFPLIRDVAERELGRPLERAFARFDPEPIAAASIGQVHRAKLPSGEDVVVKIQYPGVADAILSDLGNAAVLYRMIGMLYPGLDPEPLIDELRCRFTEEIDYLLEAENQRTFRELHAGHPFIRIPRVIETHSTARVLTSELMRGRRFDEVLADDESSRSRYGEILYRWVFGTINRHGMFNGDPHPGNYLFDDQGRIVFLDFGCVKRFPSEMLSTWKQIVISHLRGEKDAFRGGAVRLKFLPEDSPISTDLLFEYFGYFYEPFHEDRQFQFTRAYNAQSFRQIFSPGGRFSGMQKKLNMPRDFVFVNRIHWGVFSILAQLGASGNWHRIHREYLFDDAPSTELGQADAEWRRRGSSEPVLAAT